MALLALLALSNGDFGAFNGALEVFGALGGDFGALDGDFGAFGALTTWSA